MSLLITMKSSGKNELVCILFHLDVQNDLGIINNGLVFALYDYEPSNSLDETMNNELAFKDGDQLRILRRGDENESEWWWAKHEGNQQEGYVPRNYLGVCLFSRFHLFNINYLFLVISKSTTGFNGFH